MAYTHGSAGEPAFGRHNSGVGAARLRMDGFVSLNAPQVFNTLKAGVQHAASIAALPSFTTVELLVPSAAGCPKPSNHTLAPPTPKPVTTCNYELPGKSCNADGYGPVQCKLAEDCATATNQTLGHLTCAGLVVGCVGGFCKTTTTHGTHNELCMLKNQTTPPAQPPQTLINGGLVLELNVQTSVAGLVFVELQDAQTGVPLPGRTLAESRPARGNYVRTPVSWMGGSSLTALAGKKVLLTAAMTDAKLYSVSFRCSDE